MEKRGKGLCGVKGLSQLVFISTESSFGEEGLGRGDSPGEAAGLGGNGGGTPSCCISIPTMSPCPCLPPVSGLGRLPPAPSRAWSQPQGGLGDRTVTWDIGHPTLPWGGGWPVGPPPNPGSLFPSE